MATIEERADMLMAKWRKEVEERAGRKDLMPQTEIGLKLARRAYIEGSTDQRKNDYWTARKAFCLATCGRECPLGGDGMDSVDCGGLEKFVKYLE